MVDADAGLAALRKIQQDFHVFREVHGKVTEADTRVQIIDRILEEVCGWPKLAIDRERYVRDEGNGKGFVDYGLAVQAKTLVLVEAKREGIHFELPHDLDRRSLKLNGTILTDAALREAITQVRSYCDDLGVRFAVATNGYAWIVFRAVRDDIPWRGGYARVFPSLENIEEHFTKFWNLLSYSAICAGSLQAEFGTSLLPSRELHRVSARLFNSDLPLERNRLHAQLGPIVKTFFDEIGDLEQVKILQDCYVHSGSLRIVADDLNLVITDTVPKLLKDQGTTQIDQTLESTGKWGRAFAEALGKAAGELFLLLGGIGSGKTTFLKRYQRTVGASLLGEHTYWFHVPFLGPPLDPSKIEDYLCDEIQKQLRARYSDRNLERREVLKMTFQGEISALNETVLNGMPRTGREYEEALSPHLRRWQEAIASYISKLLRTIRDFEGKSIVLFIDNVDQLSPAYQQQIFLVAQSLTRQIGSVTVVALREESYYTANTQRTFSAYATRKFHVASPRFRRLIGSRIHLALDVLTKGRSDIAIPTAIDIDTQSIVELLRIVEYSIFHQNKNIARMIEALCFGNMRQALAWFSMFLMSGATDVDKMLNIYRRDGQYFVAFHEFVKSIMLSERRYYSENHSPILNLFDCGPERNSSHFTTLRILTLLLSYAGQDHPEGRGYVDLSQIVSSFEDIFDNREDLIRACNRCVQKQLIEVNTRSTENIGWWRIPQGDIVRLVLRHVLGHLVLLPRPRIAGHAPERLGS